jgi:hypothetical protein
MNKHLPDMVYNHIDTVPVLDSDKQDRTRVFAGVPGEKRNVKQIAKAIKETCGCYTAVLEKVDGGNILMIRLDMKPTSSHVAMRRVMSDDGFYGLAPHFRCSLHADHKGLLCPLPPPRKKSPCTNLTAYIK